MEPRPGLPLLVLAVAFAAPALLPAGAAARTLLTQRQALALAFPPGTTIERRTRYLSDAALDRASRRGRVKIDSSVWTYYVGLA